MGVPGPHDVPGENRARRNSPSPGPGTADVVDVGDDVDVLEDGVLEDGVLEDGVLEDRVLEDGVLVLVVEAVVVVGLLVPEPSNP
jgi:hypothetical protein